MDISERVEVVLNASYRVDMPVQVSLSVKSLFTPIAKAACNSTFYPICSMIPTLTTANNTCPAMRSMGAPRSRKMTLAHLRICPSVHLLRLFEIGAVAGPRQSSVAFDSTLPLH